MKKLFLLVTAVCAAISIQAKVININLNAATSIAYTGCSATPTVTDGVLHVQYSAGGWQWAGVEFTLDNLTKIPTIAYDYKGDGASGFDDGIVLFVYLRDVEGNRWIQNNYWPNIQHTTWQSEIITPDGNLDWDEPGYAIGTQAFTRLGFIVNPGQTTSGSFDLRNIQLTVLEDGEEPPVTDNPDSLMYNGVILPHNTEFSISQCGTVGRIDIEEVSGIACSRTTPGYIWMESDNYGSHIVATTEQGQERAMKVNFPNLKALNIRYWDWEDLCGGVYNGTNYLFIGAFGDNNEEDDFYSIVYFEEPAITGGEVDVDPAQIHYVYPDGLSHNNEALMYDNVEQTLYIITKVYYNVCQVFSLPFRTDYGDETQTLTYVCDLGLKSDIGMNPKNQQCRGFHLVTGADISADGKYVLIKNHNNIEADYAWVLYWERQGSESIAETVKRQPEVIDCYKTAHEWQGEAICWLDDNTFYSTSDSDYGEEPPIYKYTRSAQGFEAVYDGAKKNRIICIDNVLYLRTERGLFTIDGKQVSK